MDQDRDDYRDGPPQVRPWWIDDVAYPAAVALSVLSAVGLVLVLIVFLG
jgi:hypothetical protein